ncbi:alanine--glyoxylate aminotransferase family protein [Paracoccus sp. P2]|uniref:Aminotransferase class V-fold PLP-dependent enzyme n=1 Tax=Paracoccus pantotrophus TaxID=82367 RepID=A0A7H9BWP4_PARPN|nr:aminotransferase class V-fold PLP-dependent enzyme [Paracoccus pantotrophus]QLH15552.1 aminotransferase class V-fold PLP-dependent enzyme [Paracoccus pantotrophus]RDD93597.1 aminotransferase class V-fold PLP-dependent enzyme [Paracoccus pantotrophus]RNI20073.1 aminotransferase class V-fold PLP-dependent enzyme [Paracoccus pantotrophus]WGR65695.1 aminotransferase class V-fold PLP-dependent enzyme [Paracoccus pantotrophus]
MSFAHGRAVLAIPGPSPVPDRVLRAMHRASPDIYGPELAAENRAMIAGLKRLAGTAGHVAPYIGNGHAGWEAANVNLLDRGERALALVSGHFGRSWAASARALGIEVEELDFGLAPPDPQRLADRLAQDREGRVRAVLVCQVDTASSARADIPALRAAMGGHPAFLAVDAIASLGCEPLQMDEWGVDLLVSASQKGLMVPPGLAFVWFSDRVKARARSSLATPYWDWTPRAEAQELWQFWGGTPPVQHIFGMNEALLMLLDEETLPAAWARHEGLARATWTALDCWGAGHPGIGALIADPAGRARSVTAARLPQAGALRDWTATRAGVTLGIGLGAADPDNALRIAHMGHANAHQLLGVLAAVEAGMTALSIPHGKGALEAAAAEIARLA